MIITCEKVSKNYLSQNVLQDLTFSVNFAHTLVLVGPSGGGKSTLLRLLAGLITPEEGTIRVNDVIVPREESDLLAYRQRIGMVFQSFNLFPHLTALENVQLPLERVHKLSDAKARAMEALKRFHLESHAQKRPTELSGGQCQRVAIARALAVEPEFLLMDEPTSALDPEMTAEVLDVVATLREAGRPLVLATHEMGFARKTADYVAFIADRQVLEITPAEQFFTKPTTNSAGRFLEKILKY